MINNKIINFLLSELVRDSSVFLKLSTSSYRNKFLRRIGFYSKGRLSV